MSTLLIPRDNAAAFDTGDNCRTDDAESSVISPDLRAPGAAGQSAGHVPSDPHELSDTNLRVSHFKSNFPSLTHAPRDDVPANVTQHGHRKCNAKRAVAAAVTGVARGSETAAANGAARGDCISSPADNDSDDRDASHSGDVASRVISRRDKQNDIPAVRQASCDLGADPSTAQATQLQACVRRSSRWCGESGLSSAGRSLHAWAERPLEQRSMFVSRDPTGCKKPEDNSPHLFNVKINDQTNENKQAEGSHAKESSTERQKHPAVSPGEENFISENPVDANTDVGCTANANADVGNAVRVAGNVIRELDSNINAESETDAYSNGGCVLHANTHAGCVLDADTKVKRLTDAAYKLGGPPSAEANVVHSKQPCLADKTPPAFLSAGITGSESNFRLCSSTSALPPIAERAEREAGGSVLRMPGTKSEAPFALGRLRVYSTPESSSAGLSSPEPAEAQPVGKRLLEVAYRRAISIEGSASLASKSSHKRLQALTSVLLATAAPTSANCLPPGETGNSGNGPGCLFLKPERNATRECDCHGNSATVHEPAAHISEVNGESLGDSGKPGCDETLFTKNIQREMRGLHSSLCSTSLALASDSAPEDVTSSEALKASEGRLQSILRRNRSDGNSSYDVTSTGMIDARAAQTKRSAASDVILKEYFPKEDRDSGERNETVLSEKEDTDERFPVTRSPRDSLNGATAVLEKDHREVERRTPQLEDNHHVSTAFREGAGKLPARRHSLAACLEAPEKTRRNSVTLLPKKATRVPSLSSLSGSPTDRQAALPRRRSSSKETLARMLESGKTAMAETSSDIASGLELLTWTHLMSAMCENELRTASVTKTEVTVRLPVCQVNGSGTGSSFTFTSMDAVKQTLLKAYPTLQVLKTEPSSNEADPVENHGVQHTVTPSSMTSSPVNSISLNNADGNADGRLYRRSVPSSPEDAGDEMPYFNKSRRTLPGQRKTSSVLSVAMGLSPDDRRRVSINSCIRTMRQDSSNYDNQLLGCQNVGHYANEETLKVVLAKSDAISCVINAMKMFPEKKELQCQACASLLKMASVSEANCLHICQNEGVAALVGTMRRYDDNLDIMRLVLHVLGYLSTAAGVPWELVGQGCHCDVLAAMSRHAHDRSIVRQCCFVLGNLVISVETAQQLMLVGGVHTIISMMNRFYDDSDILENGCRALGSFAFYDETCLDVAQAGATETVLTAMTSDKSSISVKECGCWALACLTTMAKTCEEFVSLDGLHVLLRALEAFPQEEHLQEYGVAVLCNIGTFESTLDCVSTPRIVALLTAACQHFPDTVELLEKVFAAFGQIANTEQVYRSLLSDGGLRSIFSVMTSLPENKCIQENGCRVIGNMAIQEHLRKSTEQQGASQSVIAAMLHMDTCPDVQLCGCVALMNLTADITDNKMRVKNNSAVPMLLSTLRSFADQPDVTVSVLKTLGNLVDLEEVCRQLIDDRGLDTIVNIAISDQPRQDIRVFACLVLSGFTALSDLPEEQRLQIERILVLVQSCSPNDPDIALSMCQGLHNLLKSGTLVTDGWLDVILSTMNRFRSEPEIHLAASRIIATLAIEGKGRLKEDACCLGQEAVTSVLQTLRTFPGNLEVQLVGCGTLSCVCENLGHLRPVVTACGGIADVTAAMARFPSDDRLHAVALIALADILPIDITENLQDADSVTNSILKSMSSFLENEEIQVSACTALRKCDVTGSEELFQLLTFVRNAIRRHYDSDKVLKSAAKVFKRFGALVFNGGLTFVLTAGEPKSLAMKVLSSPTPVGSLFWETLDK